MSSEFGSEFDELIASAAAGANINDCCREAIIEAFKHNKVFKFIHNGHLYTADPIRLQNTVYNSRLLWGFKK